LKSLFLIGLILSINFSLAQTDSLESALAHTRGQVRASALESLSHKLENSNIKRAVTLATEALILASDHEQKVQQLSGWLGHLKRLQSSYDTATEYLEKALSLAEKRNDPISAAEYHNELSQLTRAQGKLSPAIQHALEARRLSEQTAHAKNTGDALYNIGYVHLIQKSYDSAMLYFRKSLSVRRASGDSSNVANSYNGIGLVYMRLEEYDESRKWYLRSIALVDSETNPRLLGMVFNNIGITYENQGKFEEGRAYYHRSIAIKKKTGDKRGMASTYGNLADNFNESGNLDESIRYANLSVALAKETRSLDYMITAHKILSYSYEKKSDYRKAYDHYVQFHQLQDSLFNINKAKEVNELITRYNVEKHEKENLALKASATLNESALSRQKIIIIVTTIGLTGVLLVLNSIYRLYGRSRKLAIELAHQKTEAEQANAQLTLAIQENANITNFLVHDLKSPMNKVAGLADLMQKDGDLNPIQQVYVARVSEVVDQGRKLIDDLLAVDKQQSIHITRFDVVEFMNALMDEFVAQAEHKNIRLIRDFPDQAVMIASDRDLLRRVFDNLLSNALKFSPQNLSIRVSVITLEYNIQISVIDQGPGFSEVDKKSLFQKFKRLSARPTNGEPSTGLGLAIVKNITEQLGGSIALTSDSGIGATFTVLLPIK
jgi:signal transduction histidine kinase/Tfp pilus assembly protein PilF